MPEGAELTESPLLRNTGSGMLRVLRKCQRERGVFKWLPGFLAVLQKLQGMCLYHYPCGAKARTKAPSLWKLDLSPKGHVCLAGKDSSPSSKFCTRRQETWFSLCVIPRFPPGVPWVFRR